MRGAVLAGLLTGLLAVPLWDGAVPAAESPLGDEPHPLEGLQDEEGRFWRDEERSSPEAEEGLLEEAEDAIREEGLLEQMVDEEAEQDSMTPRERVAPRRPPTVRDEGLESRAD